MNIETRGNMKYILAKLPHATESQLAMIRAFINGCGIAGWFSPKQEMIYDATRVLEQLPYEDIEFFIKFVYSYARKKGIEVTICGKEKASA